MLCSPRPLGKKLVEVTSNQSGSKDQSLADGKEWQLHGRIDFEYTARDTACVIPRAAEQLGTSRIRNHHEQRKGIND